MVVKLVCPAKLSAAAANRFVTSLEVDPTKLKLPARFVVVRLFKAPANDRVAVSSLFVNLLVTRAPEKESVAVRTLMRDLTTPRLPLKERVAVNVLGIFLAKLPAKLSAAA